MALECWRKSMIEPVKEKLIKLILEEIHKFVEFAFCVFQIIDKLKYLNLRDRKGESVNQSIIHGCINSLVDVADKRKKSIEVKLQLFSIIKKLHF